MSRRRLAALAAVPVAAVLLAAPAGCGDSRPPAPVCGYQQVAEYDGDGWECEPDLNGNGVDDEDDAKGAGKKKKKKH